MVKPLSKPVEAILNAKEEYVAYSASFKSRRTNQEPLTEIHGPMIVPYDITRELQSARSKPPFNQDPSMLYNSNNRRCWVSSPPPSDDYDDWHMEIDLGARHLEGRFIQAIVLQGRVPSLKTFPSPRNFPSEDIYKKFEGPFYPVVAYEHPLNLQWVEKFELFVRCARGAWFSLGIFAGNTNRCDQVRINLPVIDSLRTRFLRVRPLSLDKGGFHGPAPAFRIGVVALRESRGTSCPQSTKESLTKVGFGSTAPREVPKGFVRYKVALPLEMPSVDEKGENHSHSMKSAYVVDEAVSIVGKGSRQSARERTKIYPTAKTLLKYALDDAR
jgi:hypothetical protein